MSSQNSTSGSNTNNDVIEIDLLELFRELKKRLLVIILCTVIGGGVAAAYSFLLATPMYKSTAKMYVLTQSSTVTNSVTASDVTMSSYLVYDCKEMVTSRPVITETKNRLGLKCSNATLQSMISVENPDSTRILNVSVQSDDPEDACNIANTLVTVAKEHIAETMTLDATSIFEHAVAAEKPFKPNKTKNILIGMLIGALIACAAITIKYITRGTINDEEDIERATGLAVLAKIPYDKSLDESKLFGKSSKSSKSRNKSKSKSSSK